MFGALNESQFVGTGCLIGHFTSAGILVNDNSMADSKQSIEVVQILTGTFILNALGHLALHNIHRALNHALVIRNATPNVLFSEITIG